MSGAAPASHDPLARVTGCRAGGAARRDDACTAWREAQSARPRSSPPARRPPARPPTCNPARPLSWPPPPLPLQRPLLLPLPLLLPPLLLPLLLRLCLPQTVVPSTMHGGTGTSLGGSATGPPTCRAAARLLLSRPAAALPAHQHPCRSPSAVTPPATACRRVRPVEYPRGAPCVSFFFIPAVAPHPTATF